MIKKAYDVLTNEDNSSLLVFHKDGRRNTSFKNFEFEIEDNNIFYYYNGNFSLESVEDSFKEVVEKLLSENDIDFKFTKINGIKIIDKKELLPMAYKSYNMEEVKAEATDFLENKKKKETTYINYRTSINYFIYYLSDVAEVEEINSDNKGKILEGFQSSLLTGFKYSVNDNERTVKVKAEGVNTHVRRIRTFLNKYLGLPVEINKLQVDKPKYKSLSKEEIELLITECSNYWSNEEIAVRNTTLIKFLFNTAFRINEALTLRTENIFSDNGSYSVKIHEKGKASGVLTEVVISENTFNLLNDYINIKSVPSDFVFSSIKPSKELEGKAKAFNRQNFNKSIVELASYTDSKHNTDISKTVENNSSHVFRHSKATYLLNTVKEDVVTVQKILRHSSIDSTLIYLNPQEEAINKVRINNDI